MSEVSAFRIDAKSGELSYLNRQSTQGKNPAHLIADKSNRFVLVANYATGTVAVLPRRNDGSLEPVCHLEVLPGDPGPNRIDQASSHPHELVYDRAQEIIVVPDKGLDRIFSYRFDVAQGRLVPCDPGSTKVRSG